MPTLNYIPCLWYGFTLLPYSPPLSSSSTPSPPPSILLSSPVSQCFSPVWPAESGTPSPCCPVAHLQGFSWSLSRCQSVISVTLTPAAGRRSGFGAVHKDNIGFENVVNVKIFRYVFVSVHNRDRSNSTLSLPLPISKIPFSLFPSITSPLPLFLPVAVPPSALNLTQ